MNRFSIGEIANARVGRNLVEAVVLECGPSSFKVKSVASGREFYTVRLEKINNNQEETIMIEDDINTNTEAEVNAEVEDDTPNPAPESLGNTPKEKHLSLFDAAIEVLKQSEIPMSTKEIVQKAVELGLWKATGAKTPEQTLYSAIHRENTTKEHPRIIKSDLKGKFKYSGE